MNPFHSHIKKKKVLTFFSSAVLLWWICFLFLWNQVKERPLVVGQRKFCYHMSQRRWSQQQHQRAGEGNLGGLYIWMSTNPLPSPVNKWSNRRGNAHPEEGFNGSTAMASVKKDDRLTRTQSFLCVGLSGFFSKTVTSPLEVVKIKSQVGTFHSKRGFLQSFLLVSQHEGLRGFWKGNLASCLRLFPYTAVHLATYKK